MDVDWKTNFKKEYELKGEYDLQSQVPYLSALAAEYEDRYQTSNNWTDCLKAHALYSSCGAREPTCEKWSKHAFSLQLAYWKGREIIDYQSQQQLTRSHLKEIGKIRSDFRKEVKLVHDECGTFFPPHLVNSAHETELSTTQFDNTMTDISLRCTRHMIDFACHIMEAAVDALKERPPCPFTVAAIGSLARGEATPYSDLEYMFIIEEKTEKTLEYFEALAVTSYFLIGSLQETKLSYMAISELDGWFEDKSQNGFKIDGLSPGAGNIPTGNGINEERNHFIVTSEELIKRYKVTLDNPDDQKARRGDLTAMLAYIKPIYSFGDNNFVPDIEMAISGMTPNTKRKEINMRMLQADIAKFDFTPGQRVLDKDFKVHIKKDIFRFPSILLLDLTQVFGITGISTWETLDLLRQKHLISEPFQAAMRFLVTSACFIRLSAYLFHDSHDDRMSVAPESEHVPLEWSSFQVINSKPVQYWYPPAGLWFSMMNYLNPLRRVLNTDDKSIIQVMNFTEQIQPTWADRVRTLYCCERVTAALGVLQEQFGNDIYEDTEHVVREIAESFPDYLEDIAHLFYRGSYFGQALLFFHYIATRTTASEFKRADAEYMGLLCQSFGQCNDQEMLFKTNMFEPDFFDESCVTETTAELKREELFHLKTMVDSSMNLESWPESSFDATLCFLLLKCRDNRYKELLALSREERLDEIKISNKNEIFSLIMLGSTYAEMGDYTLAEKYYLKCENMFVELFGVKTMTIERAVLYQKIGSNLNYLKRYQESEEMSLRAIEMYKEVYGNDCAHSDIIMVYHDLGINAKEVKDFEMATEFFNKALDMSQKLQPRNTSTTKHIGKSLLHMANNYDNMKNFGEAIDCYFQIQAIYKDICGDKEVNIDSAAVLMNLGCIYDELKQFNEAELYYFQALDAYKAIPGCDKDVAKVLCNIGICYEKSQQFIEALEYFHMALDIYKALEATSDNNQELQLPSNQVNELVDLMVKCFQRGMAFAHRQSPVRYDLIIELRKQLKAMYVKVELFDNAAECNDLIVDSC